MKQEDIFVHAKEMLLQEFPCELRLLGVRMSSWKSEIDTTQSNDRQKKLFKSYFTKVDHTSGIINISATLKNNTEVTAEKEIEAGRQDVVNLDANIDTQVSLEVQIKDEKSPIVGEAKSAENRLAEKRKFPSPKQSPAKKKRKSNEGLSVEVNQKTLDCFFKAKK